MSLNFDSIPKYCISLTRCQDRRVTVEQEFKKVGIEFEFFDATDKLDIIVPEISVKKHDTEAAGVLACALSHLELIYKAKTLGLPEICIFEDDVIFCDDFKDRIKYIENLSGFEYDILALGGHFDKEITYNYAIPADWPKMHKVKRMGGTYAYIFKSSVYDFILRNYNYNYGADEFYSTFVYPRFKSYAFVPFLVGCMPCKSEITEQAYVYENIGWHYKQGPEIGIK